MLLKGLFNICDKVILAIVILEQWRELFKHGVPLSTATDSCISVWNRCRQVRGTVTQQIASCVWKKYYEMEL